MATVVNVGEAKNNLSRLVNAALAGEEVVVARHGVPTVRLQPINQPEPRRFGAFPELRVPTEELLEPMTEEELALWE